MVINNLKSFCSKEINQLKPDFKKIYSINQGNERKPSNEFIQSIYYLDVTMEQICFKEGARKK